jgi:hypothetical protein
MHDVAMTVVWIVRAVLVALVFPILFPVTAMRRAFVRTGLGLALFSLGLVLVALAVVCALALGILGRLFDTLILAAAVALFLRWPRGVRRSFSAKLLLAYRGLRNAVSRQLKTSSLVDYSLCLGVTLIAVVMSLSSGLLSLIVTLIVALLVVGMVWKWPTESQSPPLAKARQSLRDLFAEIRRMLR